MFAWWRRRQARKAAERQALIDASVACLATMMRAEARAINAARELQARVVAPWLTVSWRTGGRRTH